jgi:DNA ligase (NAD+)
MELQLLLNDLSEAYDRGEPLISDYDYDIIQELAVYEGAVRRTSDTVGGYDQRIEHPIDIMRGSLDKVYYLTDDEPRTNKSRKSLPEWLKSVREQLLEHGIDVDKEEIIITAKYDGLSCVSYTDSKNATLWLTRGDTDSNLGVDISHVMNAVQSIKQAETETSAAIQHELMVRNTSLAELNERFVTKYKNTRSIAAGIIRSKDIEDYRYQYIEAIPLKIYKNGKLEIHPEQLKKYPHLKCTISDIDKIRKFADENRNACGVYRTDGLVITFANPKVQQILGRTNNINNFEVAYKFTEEKAIAKVQDIIFQVSEFGTVTPVLVITPIVMKGNTITRITMHNKARFDDMNLKYFDTVQILYDIIPYVSLDDTCRKLNKMSSQRHIPFTHLCPECGSELDLTGVFVQCHNRQCPSIKVGRMINFLDVLNCKGIGPETVRVLHDIGVITDIPTLFHIGTTKQMNVIRATHGFGELKTKMILREINKIKRLDDYMFFAAIGIKGLSKRFFQEMFREYEVNIFIKDMNEKSWETIDMRISGIPGIGPKKGQMLIKAIKQDRKMINRCLKYIKLNSTFGTKKSEIGVVFTGFRDDELATHFRSVGYTVQDNITSQTVLVVCKDKNSTSDKLKKARDKGIEIVEIKDVKGKFLQVVA